MTTTTALCACGQPVSDGYLCREDTDCRRGDCLHRDSRRKHPCLTCALTAIPTLRGHLDLTLSRQTSTGEEDAGRRATEVPLPYHLGASDALEVLGGVLRRAWRDLGRPGTDPLTIDVAAELLLAHIGLIRQQPQVGRCAGEIGDAVLKAIRTVDLRPKEHFCGPCDGHGLVIGSEAEDGCVGWVYAENDDQGQPRREAACKACGAQYEAATRRDWMLEAAEEYLAPAAALSRFLTWKGSPLNASTLRTWAQRGRIQQRGEDRDGRPMYLVKEVRQLVNDLEAKRSPRRSSNDR